MINRNKSVQNTMAVLLIISSIAIAFYQVIDIDTVANGVLMYIAQAFLLAGSIFGLDYYVHLIAGNNEKTERTAPRIS